MYTRSSAASVGRRGARGPGVRHGITSVLAMLYLVLFSTLALGFYAQTNLSTQVVSNERHAVEALAAADAGVRFVRYHLSALDVPPGLTPANAFEEAYMQLATRIDGTGNVSGGLTGYDA